jgi:hypothetical protein
MHHLTHEQADFDVGLPARRPPADDTSIPVKAPCNRNVRA